MVEIRQLGTDEARLHLDDLAGVLLDCVAGGASVSFMASLTIAEARLFFQSVIESIQKSGRILLAAFLDSKLVGTVQIITATPANQPHRADVAKLLVHRSARNQGIATRLMRQAEQASIEAGKTLLVLDTTTGHTAERLYPRLGWIKVGVIPNYATLPDGTPSGTTIFYKQLS